MHVCRKRDRDAMDKQSSTELIAGGCHCGAVRFEFYRTKPGSQISVRACGCGFCQKHRGVWTSDPEGGFRLKLVKPEIAHQYRWGTKTAVAHVCQTCGVVPITTCSMGSRRYAVLNIHTFVGVQCAIEQKKRKRSGDITLQRRWCRRCTTCCVVNVQ